MKRSVTFLAIVALILSSFISTAAAKSDKAPTTASAPGLVLKAGTQHLGKNPNALRNQGEGLYVVQFADVITMDSRKALSLANAQIVEYLPEFAFLVSMNGEDAAQLAENDLVAGVEKYKPAWKLAKAAAAAGEYRIFTVPGAEKAVAAEAKGSGASVRNAANRQVVAQLNSAQAAELAASESVTFIEPVKEHELMNNKSATLITVSSTGGPWTNGLTGTGQVIGIADTGLDTGSTSTLNPDLKNRLQVTPIALGRTGNWSDTDGHGTHVAGSVVGDGSSGATDGGVSIKGMAPAAKIVFQSVLDSSGGLGGIPADLNTLFSQAASNGAKIHTNSWGVPLQYGGWVYDAEAQQVDQYTWNNKSFTVLFAAGNDGQSQSGSTVYNSVTTPGTAKNAITVGASENNRSDKGTYADNPNQIAVFSSRGTAPDGRIKPDIVAPGTWILSTRSTLAPDGNYWGTFDSYHAFNSGTSMATPVTAGATALVRQFYTDVKSITPAASLLKATLINGAKDLGTGWGSRDQGWGRIDLASSLYPTSGRANWFENETKSLSTGVTNSYTFTASAGQILKFTLVWTDYQGAVQAATELVNDLDLEVTAPGGSIYKGNCFVSNTASTSCASFDRKNNVENVYFSAPTVGTYTVKVKGYNVPNGPQPYSLVASGNGLVSGGGSGDTTPPTVSITAPAAGATITGTATVTASASDNVGVTSVEFYVDGALKNTDSASPWSWSWDSTTASNGSHSLTARAYDAAGNNTTSTAVSVTVNNPTGGTTANETFTGTLSSGGYKDLYIDVTATGTVSLSMNWTTTASDLDLYLYNPSGTQVSAAESGTARPETITYNATTTGRYRIRAKSYSGSSSYTLTGTHPINTATTSAFSQSGSLAAGATQNYTITVGKAGAINMKLDFPSGTDFDLYLLNSSGTTVASATSSSLRPETVSYAVSAAGTYTVRVKAYSGSGAFTVTGYYPK